MITAVFDKTIFKPNESVKLSVTANCSGFFQLNSDGNENFDFEKDTYRYSYSPNKTTDFILGGPEFTSFADMQLKPRSDNKYTHKTIYKLVLVFRDGLLQTSNFPQDICVDGTGPKVDGFSPDIKDPFDFNPEIIITFDEDIGYADSSCLQIEPSDGKIKLLRISKNQAFFSVTGLKALSDYSATVRGVKDIAGNVMEDSAPYSFKTISGDLQIKDVKGNTNFAAYRGFEESSLNLKAYFKND
ncbi:MAG TPA: Ig-like domain-containing protein, partial [Flexilinea sp.]|nr:Ig-like domain-containing protein [Flexilinea sp.]